MSTAFLVTPKTPNALIREQVYKKGKWTLSVISTWEQCALIIDTIPPYQVEEDAKVTELTSFKFKENEPDYEARVNFPNAFPQPQRARLEKKFKADPYSLLDEGWDMISTTYRINGDFESRSVPVHTLTLFTSEIELAFKPLSKKMFQDYAKNGMPQSEFDDSIAVSDPIFDENTTLSVDNVEMPNFQSRFKKKYDLAVLAAQSDELYDTFKAQVENVQYAVSGEAWIKRSWYDLVIYENFDFSKLEVRVSRFPIFGTGTHRDTFSISYDGLEFEFRENCGANYSEYFLIDSKGKRTDLELLEEDDDDDD